MGAERNHREREVRFQGDWAGPGMADHYTKSKLTITLGMVGSLVRDLKEGWRQGPKAAPDLIAIDLQAPPLPEVTEKVPEGEEDPDVAGDDDGWESDESDMAAIAAPMIEFYVQNTSNVLEKLISPALRNCMPGPFTHPTTQPAHCCATRASGLTT